MSADSTTLGHRQRLRERFSAAYTAGMHDYEVLELLLTFSIPRRDVKPIAKDLIARFGSLKGVVDAAPDELRKTKCIGDGSVTLIKLIKEMCALYLEGAAEKKDLVTSPAAMIQFSRMKLAGLPHEAFMCVFLSTQNEMLSHAILNEGTVDQVAVYPRRIVEKALAAHAAGIIIAHNHPSGYVEPSEEDKRLTRSVQEAGRLLDIRLIDHLVVGRNGYFSFVERGLI